VPVSAVAQRSPRKLWRLLEVYILQSLPTALKRYIAQYNNIDKPEHKATGDVISLPTTE